MGCGAVGGSKSRYGGRQILLVLLHLRQDIPELLLGLDVVWSIDRGLDISLLEGETPAEVGGVLAPDVADVTSRGCIGLLEIRGPSTARAERTSNTRQIRRHGNFDRQVAGP